MFKSRSSDGLIFPLAILGLFVLGLWGWVCNIIAIIHADSVTGMVIARVAGVFIAPLGAVLGFF